jgi:hypothetical protein
LASKGRNRALPALPLQGPNRGSVESIWARLKLNDTCWFERMSSMRGRLTVLDAAKRSRLPLLKS